MKLNQNPRYIRDFKIGNCTVNDGARVHAFPRLRDWWGLDSISLIALSISFLRQFPLQCNSMAAEHEFLTFQGWNLGSLYRKHSNSINFTFNYLGSHIYYTYLFNLRRSVSLKRPFNTRISTSCSYFWASNLVYQLSSQAIRRQRK